jgi:serine protease AprX
MSRLMRTLFFVGMLLFALGAPNPSGMPIAASFSPNGKSGSAAAWQAKIAPQVLEQAASGPVEFLVVLKAQADLSAAQKLPTKAEKGAYVYQQLSQLAARTQKPVVAELKALGVDYRPFWVTNMIWVHGAAASLQAMAQRADVAHIDANPWVQMELPQPVQASALQRPTSTNGVEASISQVNAPQLWEAGFNGQGVVVGGQDTGYQWDHEALKDHYRGWDGTVANHNYNWHDAIHNDGASDCPADSKVPCDDYFDSHGTHTMGTMVGEDPGGDHKIGMAPGARWIGCRNMNQGRGSPASYSECFQWFIAPTDLNGQNPRPDLAPDVINNSWGCPTSEGCDSWDVLQSDVDNTRAAGIVVVASAGNSGPACNTVDDPPAMYASVFTVGATDNGDNIAAFSSRGPGYGSNLLKPDVSAPGVSILSSIKTGYGYLSGTSMASPHVTGLVALLLSADPLLRGDVDAIENIIRQSSVPLTTTETCGGVPGSQVPNNTYGYGRIDATKAFALLPNLLTLQNTAPALVAPGDPITYTLTVSHKDASLATTNIEITDVVPSDTTFINATQPFTKTGNTINWKFPQLGPNESQSVQLVVRSPSAETTIINDQFQAKSDQFIGPRGGSVTTKVAKVYSLALAPNNIRFAAAGSTVVYTHILTNTGNFADTYTLKLTSNLGWASLSSPTILNVLPEQSVPVQIDVSIPENAVFRQNEYSVLNVYSNTDPAVFASVTDITNVAFQTLMLPILMR